MSRPRHTLACLTVALLAVLGISACGSGSSSATHGHWSTLKLTGPVRAMAVSCAHGPFCMVLEASPDYATWQTATYGGGGQLGPVAKLPGGAPGETLACASSQFCVSYAAPGDGSQSEAIWNGSTWTAHTLHLRGDPSGTDLTCPSTQLCLAIGDNGSDGAASLLSFSHGTVTQTPFANHGLKLAALTCAAADDCYVSSPHGETWHWRGPGTGWTGPSPLTVSDAAGSADPVTELACTTGPYCLGLGAGGGVVVDSGNGFHVLSGVTALGGTDVGSFSDSCGAAGFCLLPTAHGLALLADGHLHTIGQPPVTPAGAVSCTGTKLCLDTPADSSAKVLVFRRS